MTFRIPAGRHRSRPWRLNFWWRRNSFTWVVKFRDSCRYELQGPDQLDTNKIVGISYPTRPRFIKKKLFNRVWCWWPQPMRWTNSARFGWRYDIAKGQVEILAYCYVKGQRIIQSICFCEIGKEHVLQLKILSNSYYLAAHQRGRASSIGSTFVDHYHNKQFKYRLGVFFGGNQVAPHDMTIELKRG